MAAGSRARRARAAPTAAGSRSCRRAVADGVGYHPAVVKKPKRTLALGKRITIDPAVMLGKPVIRGTRITVECILEKLAADTSIEAILRDYPRLARSDVLAAVAFAHHLLATDDLLPSRDAG